MKVVIFECPVMKVAVFGLLLFEKGDSVILEFYTANRKVKDNVGMKKDSPQSPAAHRWNMQEQIKQILHYFVLINYKHFEIPHPGHTQLEHINENSHTCY
jgi:hypothetical protein